MITYDLFLPAIDFVSPGVKKDLKTSYFIVKKLYKRLGLPSVYLSKFQNKNDDIGREINKLGPEDIIALSYKDVQLGDLVIASTIRYYYCNGPEWDNPIFLNKAREFAESSLKLAQIFEDLFIKERPDKIVTSHGIYVSWGIPFRMARKMNIAVDVYGASYRKDTLRFYHNAPNAPFPEGEWELFRNQNLNEKEKKEVEKYTNTRSDQSEDSVSLFSDKDVFPAELKHFIEESTKSERKLFCLFTNISWDAYMFRQESHSFNSMIEWVKENIEYFSNRKDASLIIKAHPAEDFFKVPEEYRIKRIVGNALPENIYFINEVANIKPVLLYPFINVGLIYTSTVSIEMAFENIPVLTAGVGGHYSNNGFTIDPLTKKEYFEKINSFIEGSIHFEPDLEMAKRYMHFRFFKEALKNDLLVVENYKIKKYNFSSLNDLMPGINRTLDIICNGILNDSRFLN